MKINIQRNKVKVEERANLIWVERISDLKKKKGIATVEQLMNMVVRWTRIDECGDYWRSKINVRQGGWAWWLCHLFTNERERKKKRKEKLMLHV